MFNEFYKNLRSSSTRSSLIRCVSITISHYGLADAARENASRLGNKQ